MKKYNVDYWLFIPKEYVTKFDDCELLLMLYLKSMVSRFGQKAEVIPIGLEGLITELIAKEMDTEELKKLIKKLKLAFAGLIRKKEINVIEGLNSLCDTVLVETDGLLNGNDLNYNEYFLVNYDDILKTIVIGGKPEKTIKVYTAVLSLMRDKYFNEVKVSYEYLSSYTGLAKTTVIKYSKLLKQNKLLTMSRPDYIKTFMDEQPRRECVLYSRVTKVGKHSWKNLKVEEDEEEEFIMDFVEEENVKNDTKEKEIETETETEKNAGRDEVEDEVGDAGRDSGRDNEANKLMSQMLSEIIGL